MLSKKEKEKVFFDHDHLSGQSFGQLRHPICGIPLLGKIAADIPSSRNAASGTSRLAEFFDRKGDHGLFFNSRFFRGSCKTPIWDQIRAFAIGFAFCASCLQADYKTEIQQCQLQLQSAAKENKASLALQLAELYSKDQDLEMAFRTYLQALEWTVPVPEPVPTPDELKHYAEGLTIYLDHSGATPGAIALKLQEQLNPVLKEHPDYYLVNFLMAAAFANVGLFQEFFQTFYQSYQRYPTHYMAYKTQAVLHIKLYERVRTAAEREEQREAVMAFVRKAMDKEGVAKNQFGAKSALLPSDSPSSQVAYFQSSMSTCEEGESLAKSSNLASKAIFATSSKNAKDSGLYKLMMLFASEKEKPLVVKDCLNKILEDPMIIARGDIAFLVQQAASVQEWERAQQLIDKAKELFKYSRIVIAAQEYLDKQKTASK